MTRYHANITLPDFYDTQQEEKKILKFWAKQKTFEKIQKARSESKEEKLVFHSGPVFPTGSPHSGHVLNSIVKDVLTRYGHQKDRFVESRFGWDCHGLPVEHEVDKELGIKSPADIQALGLPTYNNECREFVQRHSAKWKSVFERVGNLVDFTKEYQTMSTEYMERVWCVFKQLYDKGVVYQARKVQPYSTACWTNLSNFEAEQNCREETETGMTISVDIVDSDEKLLMWTTTPLALVSNIAVRVNPRSVYVKVKVENKIYILSKKRLEHVFKKPSEYTILEEFLGETLRDLKYKPLFEEIPVSRDLRVLLDSSVSDDVGTGIVPLDEAIVESLKERGHVVSVDEVKYAKQYCWRSDTQLISKNVSSWFIRMEGLTEKLLENNANVNWFPAAEKERYTEWLRDHSQDWAVSRTRYWGTPIPIWSSPSGDEVVCVGSIEELKKLTGKTDITDLHRECVDWMVIPSRTPGNPPLRRVNEVFDCWFESGALPFALGEGHTQAEFVAEGVDQTRGWFYTTLVLSTALSQPAPFRNVLATGLVQEPDGSKVSKRKHNQTDPMRLIEKYGADCVRLYLMSTPLTKCESLTLQEEGVASIAKTVIQPLYRIFHKCTSQLRSPSWVNYGYVTEWYGFGHVIDQWILSCMESLLMFYDEEMKAYRLHTFLPKLVNLIQQLEDWYMPIRRPDSEPEATHGTSVILFNVLYRISLILAPFAPFFPEYMYQIHRPFHVNWRRHESIHNALLLPLDKKLIDTGLELRVSRMQAVIQAVRALRARHIVPLHYQISELVVIHHHNDFLHDIKLMKEHIAKLVNAKEVRETNDRHEIRATLKLELSSHSALSGSQQIMSALQELSDKEIESLIQDDPISIQKHSIPMEDLQVSYRIDKELEPNHAVEMRDDFIIVMKMNKGLFYYEEGTVKEFANRMRNLKKKANYYPRDPATVWYSTKDECLRQLIAKHGEELKKAINCSFAEYNSVLKETKDVVIETVDVKGLPVTLHLNIKSSCD